MQGVVSPLPMDQGLEFTHVSAALAAQRRADGRQPKGVWQAFRRLVLPPQDLDFIHTCLWRKLSVGARLRAIRPSVSDRCPFDSSLEDIYHCRESVFLAHHTGSGPAVHFSAGLELRGEECQLAVCVQITPSYP